MDASAAPADGEWHLVVESVRDGKATLYVDGKRVSA